MPRREDPTARARLVRAATRLFYERGVVPVGVAEIVAEAGTGKNVLYRHFPGGKEDLVLAYLEEFAERLGDRLDDALADAPPGGQLVAIAHHVASLVTHRGYRGCPFRNHLRETRDTTHPSGRFALAQVRALRRRIERACVDLGTEDPAQLAARVWVVLEGLYAVAPYPERRTVAATAVSFVEDLVA